MLSFISMLLLTSNVNGDSGKSVSLNEQLELALAHRNMYCGNMEEIITDLTEYNSNPAATFEPELIKHELQEVIDNFDDLSTSLNEIIDELTAVNKESSEDILEHGRVYNGEPSPELNAMHYHNERDYPIEDDRRRLIDDFNWASLRNQYNDYCLVQRSNDDVVGWPCHGGTDQKWTYNSGTEQIVNGRSNECLDFNFGDGDDVYGHACHSGNNQRWYFDGDRIRNRWNGECLDYSPSSDNMHLAGCHSGSNQKFRV